MRISQEVVFTVHLDHNALWQTELQHRTTGLFPHQGHYDKNSQDQGALLGRSSGAPGALAFFRRFSKRPDDAVSQAVAAEFEQARGVLVQTLDGVVQAVDAVNVVGAGKWIVDLGRPAFFLKCRQDRFLVSRRLAETLENNVA